MVLLISIVFIIQLMLSNIILLQLELSEYLIPFTMIGAMTLTIPFRCPNWFYGNRFNGNINGLNDGPRD